MESVIRIAEALDVPVSELFNGQGQESVDPSPNEDNSSSEGDWFSNTELINQAFNNALHLIVITDAGGTVLEINRAVREFSQHSKRDLVGLPIEKTSLWKNFFEKHGNVLKRAVQQTQWGNRFEETLEIVSHENQNHELTLSVSPVRGNSESSEVDMIIFEFYVSPKPE